MKISLKKFYALLNAVVIVAVIIWNYAINARGINGVTIVDLSRQYENYFTPAGYAFSIWGLIFFGLILLSNYMIYRAYIDKNENDFVLKIGPWLLVANLGNALWSYLFISDLTAASVGVLLIVLGSLLVIIKKLDMQRNVVSLPMKLCVEWPIALYAGWVSVASIANLTSYLSKVGFDSIATSDFSFSLLMIGLATIVSLYMLQYRNMRVFALVGIWALVAIATKQWSHEPTITWAALTGALFILLLIILRMKRSKEVYHFVPVESTED